MKFNLTKQITVFLITTSGSVNYKECLKQLNNQTLDFTLKIIKDVYPMSKAFQQMINTCKTPYFIEVDDDMILNKDAIGWLFNYITYSQQKVNEKTAIITCHLYDNHLKMNICGVKIYDTKIFKKYNYNLDSISCEVEQLKRLEQDGYIIEFNQAVLGLHSPLWTNKDIFERYYTLMSQIIASSLSVYHCGIDSSRGYIVLPP